MMRSPVAIAAIVLTASGCTLTVVGNRDLDSDTRTVEAFTQIAADDTLEVDLSVDLDQDADTIELTLTGESNLLPLIETRVAAGELWADLGDSHVEAHYPMRISASVADLARASANNVARVEIAGVERETFDLRVDNVGHIGASGVVETLMVDANNGGTVIASDLEADEAMVSVNNGAEATVCVSGQVTGLVNNGARLTVLCGGDTSEVQVRNGGSLEG